MLDINQKYGGGEYLIKVFNGNGTYIDAYSFEIPGLPVLGIFLHLAILNIKEE